VIARVRNPAQAREGKRLLGVTQHIN
jgi:hypothetical protein